MNKEEYQKLVKKYEPKENKFENVIYAFLIGGLVGFMSEGLIVLLMNFFELSRTLAGAWTCLIIILAASLFPPYSVKSFSVVVALTSVTPCSSSIICAVIFALER